MAKADDDTDPAKKDRQFIAALAKGLEVLRCFSLHGPELGASEIAAITGFPQPTVWRICHTLLELGYLSAGPDRSRMRLGLPVLGLGYSALSALPIEALAVAEMEQIARRHQGAVSLGAPDDLDMVYIQRCQGSAIIHANLRIGSRIPMATSGTGWAYLAGIGPRREDYFAAMRTRQEALWREIEAPLTAELRNYERVGYITNLGYLHPRINSVAVPVRSPDGTVVLSLSSGGISDVFTAEVLPKIGEDLQRLAGKLGPSLAFSGPLGTPLAGTVDRR